MIVPNTRSAVCLRRAVSCERKNVEKRQVKTQSVGGGNRLAAHSSTGPLLVVSPPTVHLSFARERDQVIDLEPDADLLTDRVIVMAWHQ